jgi:hypothetical protein
LSASPVAKGPEPLHWLVAAMAVMGNSSSSAKATMQKNRFIVESSSKLQLFQNGKHQYLKPNQTQPFSLREKVAEGRMRGR